MRRSGSDLPRRRQGRENTYRIYTGMSLRPPVERRRRVADPIALIVWKAPGRRGGRLNRSGGILPGEGEWA